MNEQDNDIDLIKQEHAFDAQTDTLPDTLSSSPLGDGGGLSAFASLVKVIGTSTKTLDKLAALQNYFLVADDKDKVWVIAIFSGRRPRRAVSGTLLQSWCVELTGLPDWLLAECYHTVGDLAETISLLLPDNKEEAKEQYSLSHYIEELARLEKQDEAIKKAFVIATWQSMNASERFVFNKLITGGFRIGVSQKVMVNALAKLIELDASVIAHRISGNWDPSTTTFTDLLSEHTISIDYSKPYPFYLAYTLEEAPETLGSVEDWQAEWKWDGIRGQMIKTQQRTLYLEPRRRPDDR